MSPKPLQPETFVVHAAAHKDPAYGAVTPPIYQTSTFEFEKLGVHRGFDYTRSGNPTRKILDDAIAHLEGGHAAWATATGMAGLTTLMFLFKTGDHIITGHDIYGGSFRLLRQLAPHMGIEVSFVHMADMDEVRAAIRPTTRGMLIETPSNPMLNLVDIEALTRLAHEHGIIAIADNTFMSPCCQKPFELGADIVWHSTTKYINGHCDVVGGALVAKTPEMSEKIAFLVNALGTAQAPFDSWLVLRGLRTMPLRMKAHQRSAMAVAKYLESHPKIKKVYYPGLESHPQHELARKQLKGFGGMLAFDLDLEKVDPDILLKRLKLFVLAESLGGVETLIEQPWTMSHASISEEERRAAGISEATFRVSVGIEHPDDLCADLEQALAITK